MDDRKKKSLYQAGIVVGVMLLCVLLTFWVYQLLALNAKKKQYQQLNDQIAALEQQRDQTQDKIDVWMSDW